MCALAACVAAGAAADDEAPGIRLANTTRAVWIEVGVWKVSDFQKIVGNNKSLFLVAVEPTAKSASSAASSLGSFGADGRYTMVNRACVNRGEPSRLTFFQHKDSECNSLNADNLAGKGVDGGKCVGGEVANTTTRAVMLSELLQQIPPWVPIELLKIDIQGHELPCLSGAGGELRRINNIFIEIQDLPEQRKHMYKDSHNVSAVDAKLGALGFVRQYCELNGPNGKLGLDEVMREVNCMYTQRGMQPMIFSNMADVAGSSRFEWWTGARPKFHEKWCPTELESTAVPNALDAQLRALNIHVHTPNSSMPTKSHNCKMQAAREGRQQSTNLGRS